MRFILMRQSALAALDAHATWNATALAPGQPLAWRVLPPQSCFVIALPD
jgi:cyclic beta-1,2-glucan synthetase